MGVRDDPKFVEFVISCIQDNVEPDMAEWPYTRTAFDSLKKEIESVSVKADEKPQPYNQSDWFNYRP